jgi:hypothetical protein
MSFFVGLTVLATDTIEFVPDSCIAVVTISNLQSDQGLSWILDNWINSPRESPLRDFFRSTVPQEISVAVFPPKRESQLSLTLLMNFSKKTNIDLEKLNKVIASDNTATIRNISYKGSIIHYVEEKDPKNEYAAYCIFKDMIFISTDVSLLKEAIGGSSIKNSIGYKKLKAQFPQKGDGLLLADNKNHKFVKFLRPLEEKWKMTLFLAAEHLEWMGSMFDMVDSTRVNGQILFKGTDDPHMDDIVDDAEFLGEAIKRKFIAEKISYSSEVKVKNRTVILTFTIEGIEPLWQRLFANGVLSLIRPEQ